MDVADLADAIEQARERLEGKVARTPLRLSAHLSALCGSRVWLKLENQQPTGSFKIRGATNRLLALTSAERAQGVIAASSGNHGLAVAAAARDLGVAATIFAPLHASAAKIDRIGDLGATVVKVGDDCLVAERAARRAADDRGCAYVSPYDDALVAAGQGTIGAEIAEDLPAATGLSAYVALGGGGLAAGIGAALARERPGARLIAVSPERSPAVHACLEAGRWVDARCESTLSDATAGGVDPESRTLPWCRDLIDASLLIGEDAIADALRLLHRREGLIVEGAAALAVAGLLAHRQSDAAADRVVVICGGNADDAVLRILRSASPTSGAGDPSQP